MFWPHSSLYHLHVWFPHRSTSSERKGSPLKTKLEHSLLFLLDLPNPVFAYSKGSLIVLLCTELCSDTTFTQVLLKDK